MDFFEFLKEINYFSYIGAFVKWTLLFLVLGIILLIVANRYKLFKRNNKTMNVLVKVWFIFIPVWFVLFAFQFAPVKNTQKEFNRLIVQHKEAATDYVYGFLSSVVSDSILVQKASIKTIVDTYLEESLNKEKEGEAKSHKKAKRFVSKIKRKIEHAFLSQILETKMLEGAAGYIGMDKETGKAVYRTSFHNLFKEGEIVDIFRGEVNHIFGFVYKSMLITFLIGLMIPVLEIIFARLFKY